MMLDLYESWRLCVTSVNEDLFFCICSEEVFSEETGYLSP